MSGYYSEETGGGPRQAGDGLSKDASDKAIEVICDMDQFKTWGLSDVNTTVSVTIKLDSRFVYSEMSCKFGCKRRSSCDGAYTDIASLS